MLFQRFSSFSNSFCDISRFSIVKVVDPSEIAEIGKVTWKAKSSGKKFITKKKSHSDIWIEKIEGLNEMRNFLR